MHDVGARHLRRGQAARQQETIGGLRIAHADVAEAIDDLLLRENAIGDDELVDELRVGGGGRHGHSFVGNREMTSGERFLPPQSERFLHRPVGEAEQHRVFGDFMPHGHPRRDHEDIARSPFEGASPTTLRPFPSATQNTVPSVDR